MPVTELADEFPGRAVLSVWGGSGELLDEFSGYLSFVRNVFSVECDWLVWWVVGAFSRETLE